MAPPSIVAAATPEAVVSSSRRDNPGMFSPLLQRCSRAMCCVSMLAGGRIDLDQVGSAHEPKPDFRAHQPHIVRHRLVSSNRVPFMLGIKEHRVAQQQCASAQSASYTPIAVKCCTNLHITDRLRPTTAR